ncbi:MAG: CDP-alcohol phosphatidyltransferase family protein [Planctomycetes bacterium]|nr:CDP-alcohol phosphatidyltransferase family protein [Planctomycetota bacterium]
MNLPNILTLSRVPLMFAVVGLMYSDAPWANNAAFWLFIAAALTDWLDGKIARDRGIVSDFGRFMDAVIDKVMVIGLMIALVNDKANFLGHDIVAMVLLLCILCREFAISGLRMALAMQGQIVEADAGGKVKTFAQLNAIGWLIGARMLEQGHPGVFTGEGQDWVQGARIIGAPRFFAAQSIHDNRGQLIIQARIAFANIRRLRLTHQARSLMHWQAAQIMGLDTGE